MVQELKLKFRSASVQSPSAEGGGEEGRNEEHHNFYSSDLGALFICLGLRTPIISWLSMFSAAQ